MTGRRYAAYWAPPSAHPLWRAGSTWLGRDAADAAFHAEPHEATAAPRRYGFHATLKAPIVLREGTSEAGFLQAVQAIADRTAVFPMPTLQVAWLHDFLALRPVEPVTSEHPLRRLADACVRGLDPFRAPMGEAERQRRERAPGRSRCGDALLARWGYPSVFRLWRFHLTLSDALPAADPQHTERRAHLLHAAHAFFAPALAAPLACDAVCVFVEPAPGQPFVLAHRFALAA